jgi:hypothetical protein
LMDFSVCAGDPAWPRKKKIRKRSSRRKGSTPKRKYLLRVGRVLVAFAGSQLGRNQLENLLKPLLL